MSYGRSVSRGPLSLSAKNFSITTGKRTIDALRGALGFIPHQRKQNYDAV